MAKKKARRASRADGRAVAKKGGRVNKRPAREPISRKAVNETVPRPRARRPGADSSRSPRQSATAAAPGRGAGAANSGDRYDVHPSVSMVQTWIATLKEKTGRTLDGWIELVRKSGPTDDAAKREWLKSEHGLGTNAAWWIVERAAGKGWEDGDPRTYLEAAVGYVEEMYAGGKAGLRPLHDELIKLGRRLGADVKVCPCKTIVPLYRRRVFAEVKPSTRSRIDFGLALAKYVQQGGKVPARLIDTGGLAKQDRITHKIEITDVDQIDAEVWEWLRRAYELDEE